MPFFHATPVVRRAGDLIQPSGPTPYYPHAVAKLEAARPAGAPSRDICVFSTDSPGSASQFFELQQPGTPYQVYEVEHVGTHVSAPMRLVAEISDRMAAGKAFDKVVAEYWSPTQGWYFMEWFGPSLRVLAQAAAGVDNAIIRTHRYGQDRDKSQRI